MSEIPTEFNPMSISGRSRQTGDGLLLMQEKEGLPVCEWVMLSLDFKIVIYNINQLMVYVRFPNIKTGIAPSALMAVDPKNLTATQKVMLSRNRIWGNMLGSAHKNGY